MATVLVFKALSITAPALLALLLTAPAFAATPERQINEEQANAELARQFYQQVWFSDHPALSRTYWARAFALLIGIFSKLLKWKLQGLNKPSSFFNSEGRPVVTPFILNSKSEDVS